MNFFSKLAQVVKGLAPLLTVAAGFFLPGSTVLAKVLTSVPSLIASAENAFGDGTGEIKKQYVMEGAEKIVATLTDISTGGQKETWQSIAPFTDGIVEAIVAGVNGISDQPVFDDNPAKWGM